MNSKCSILSYFIAASLLCSSGIKAQNPVSTSSPETAIFSKTGNIPVGTYTGVPDIQIPLLTIKDGDINLPISLNYNASGIKVEEDAGWAGLGWSLTTGGQITRVVRGGDDFRSDFGGYLSSESIQLKPLFNNGSGGINSTYAFFDQNYAYVNFYVQGGVLHNFSQFTTGIDPTSYDFMPDLFYFNAGGSAGRFVCDDNGNPMVLKNSKIKIERYDFSSFRVTDDAGIKYTYDLRENTTAIGSGPAYSHISSWYLTRIESANGKNVVTFNYTAANMTTNPVITTTATVSSDGTITTNNFTNQDYINYAYLTEIDYNGGKIKFESAADRTDVSGARRLTAVILTDNSDVEKRRYTLESSYFHATSMGTHTTATYTDRLRLNKVSINSDENNAYVFDYNTDYIPSKESGKDHWGYPNNVGFGIPQGIYETYTLLNNGSTVATYSPYPGGGGDYEAHWPYTQAMTLKQVTYPTKGYSKFIYEPNTFNNVPDYWQYEISNSNPSGGVIMNYPVANIDNGSVSLGQINSGYNLACRFYLDNPSDLATLYISFYNTNNTLVLRKSLSDFDPVADGHYFYLTANNLALSGNLYCEVSSSRNGNFSVSNTSFFQYFTLTLTDIALANTTSLVRKNLTEMTGAGLRTKEIINNDGSGETTYRQYQYNNDAGITSGIIMNFPVYMNYSAYTPDVLNALANYSSYSKVALSTSSGGSYIGYSQVKEIIGSNANNTTNTGSIVNYYTNAADQQPFQLGFDLPYLQTNENGLLLKKTTYNANNNKVSEIANTYNAFDVTWPSTTGAKILFYDYINNYQARAHIYWDKEFQLDYKLLNSTSTLYNVGDVTKYTQKNIAYQYQPGNPVARRVLETTSQGEQDVTEYRYADDFGSATVPGFVGQMQSANITGKPIETVKLKINAQGTRAYSGVVNEYGTGDQTGLLINQYNLYTTSSVSWDDTKFTTALSFATLQYEPHYSLKNTYAYFNAHKQVTDYSSNTVNSSFKWGYNDEYPIAECKNATSSEFYYEGFEENTANGTSMGAAHTGTHFSTNSNISWTIPNSRAYVISYWYYSGGWKYSGPVPYTSNTYTMNLGSAWDDIRIYPADAEMTTFTYQPLEGMKSMTDAKGVTTTYEYDGLQRLTDVKDQYGNVLKHNEYHYHQ